MLRKMSYVLLTMSPIVLNVYAMPADPWSGFKIFVEGVGFRGNGDFLQYADLSPVPPESVPSSLVVQEIKKVIPKYHLGYGLGVGYQFPCSTNDVEARWLHFDARDTNSITNPSSATILQVPFILRWAYF